MVNENNLITAVRAEVIRPFEEKLKRAEQLIRLYAHLDSACVSCSFGKDSMIVTFLAVQENPRIPVVFENTGIEFPETLALRDKAIRSLDLNYIELKPERGIDFFKINDRILQDGLGLDDGKKRSNICCYHLKERPFDRWRRKGKINRSFTGITAMESRHRMFLACKKGMDYYSVKFGLAKVHPIMFWREEEVWNFTKENDLPINEAYCKYGLDRVGCMWCMSYLNWREQIQRLNPRMYAFLMRKYRGSPVLTEWASEDEAA